MGDAAYSAMALTEPVSQTMRTELRRAADGAGPAAEHARVALGSGPTAVRLEAALRALAIHRGRTGSTCPSDAARSVGGTRWRELMDDARTIARTLAETGDVEITQRGTVLDPTAQWRGPIRIRLAGQAGPDVR